MRRGTFFEYFSHLGARHFESACDGTLRRTLLQSRRNQGFFFCAQDARVGFACWIRMLDSRVGFGRPCPGAVATFETLRAATVETVANHALVKPAMRAMIYHIDHELTLQYHRAKIQYLRSSIGLNCVVV